VVLFDVIMPGMDGFEAWRRLKAEARSQHIPVIMQAIRQGAGTRGGAYFLTKPVDDMKRVRDLARLKMLTDEMLMRASTEEQIASPAPRWSMWMACYWARKGTTGSLLIRRALWMGWPTAESLGFLWAASAFGLDVVLEALTLRLYSTCVFTILSTQ
jgi:CheY-like chemotaxis protein